VGARATQDIDLLIMLDETQRTQLLGILKPFGFALDVRWTEVNPFLKGRMTACATVIILSIS
jgi:hypothetical protein